MTYKLPQTDLESFPLYGQQVWELGRVRKTLNDADAQSRRMFTVSDTVKFSGPFAAIKILFYCGGKYHIRPEKEAARLTVKTGTLQL